MKNRDRGRGRPASSRARQNTKHTQPHSRSRLGENQSPREYFGSDHDSAHVNMSHTGRSGRQEDGTQKHRERTWAATDNQQPVRAPGEQATAFRSTLPFVPDTFQEQAFAALEDGRSVLVTAPTGAGKTLIADFAAYLAIARGQGLIYTTPIKALSNQKYRQLCSLFGVDRIGLVTGDVVQNRTAPLLVMTTEIVRNMLVVDPDGLANVAFLVFDEVHFLSDAERGPIWEEALVWCPPQVQLVCLSATVSNAAQIAAWLDSIHPTTVLIRHDLRPVPLEDYIYHDGTLTLVRDVTGRRTATFERVYEHHRLDRRLHHHWSTHDAPHHDTGDMDTGEIGSPVPIHPLSLPAQVVQTLRAGQLLPAIYFRFSRVGAEEVAGLAADQVAIIADAATVQRRRALVEDTLATLDSDAQALPQTQTLCQLIERGMAYHHAGLIHPLKALVETLFAAGLLEVVFATGTLSMGLHLPARAVVLADLKKFNGQAIVPLTATEYRQLTGRAGRRGIDMRGAAVMIAAPNRRFELLFRQMSGEPEPLESAFALRYNTFLNVYLPGDDDRLLLLLQNNLGRYQLLHANRSPTVDDLVETRVPPTRASLTRYDRRQVRGMRHILEQESCLDHTGHLLPRGILSARIFNEWGLVFADLILGDALTRLTIPEVAEVISWFITSKFVEDSTKGWRMRQSEPTQDTGESTDEPDIGGRVPARMAAVAREIDRSINRLRWREEDQGLDLTPPWTMPQHTFVRAWCRQPALGPILFKTGAPPGDVLQVLGQTLDLSRQGQRALARGVDGSVPDHIDNKERLLSSVIGALGGQGRLAQLLGL